MRRVLVSIYIDPEFYPPTKNAIFELAKSSDEVIVLTRNLFNSKEDEYPKNVRIIRVGKFMSVQESESISFFSKIWTFLKYWFHYQRILLASNIDTAIFYDAIPLFIFHIGIKPSKIKYWYHNHDMPDVRFTRKYSIGWFSAKYEHLAMKKIHFFSLPSKDRLVYYPNWKDMDRIFYIPNFPRLAYFENLDLHHRFENFTIIFQGAIGEGHGLEDIISILPSCPDVRLILKGPVRESYKEKINVLSALKKVNDQVQWVGLTSYEELIKLTAKCHLGIAIHQGKDEVSKTLGTASNKIYEYLACGLPIVLHDNEQFRKNVSNSPVVFFYDGQDVNLIERIKQVGDDFEVLSIQARELFCKKYTFEAYFQPVMNVLNA